MNNPKPSRRNLKTGKKGKKDKEGKKGDKVACGDYVGRWMSGVGDVGVAYSEAIASQRVCTLRRTEAGTNNTAATTDVKN